MTGATPSPRWIGPAALALFLGVPCLLLAIIAANTLRWSEAAEAIEERSTQLARLETRVRGLAAAPAVRTAEGVSLFLEAKDASLAHAELQARLADLIRHAGGRLIEMQVEEQPAAVDPASFLARVVLETRNPGFLKLLEAIERGRPLLTVEGLNVRPTQVRGAAEEDPMLRIAMAVRGYMAEKRP